MKPGRRPLDLRLRTRGALPLALPELWLGSWITDLLERLRELLVPDPPILVPVPVPARARSSRHSRR